MGIVSRHHLAQLHFHLGNYRRGAEVCREALAALADDPVPHFYGQMVPPAVQCRAYLSSCLSILGEAAAADEIGLEAVRVAERVEHRFSIALASNVLGSQQLWRGRLESACRWLEHSMELQQQLGEESRYLSAGGFLGVAYVQTGRLQDGVALIERATDNSLGQGLRYAYQRNMGCLAYARLHEGRLVEARQCAEEALGLARRQKQRVSEVRLLHLLAQILAATQGPGLDPMPEAVARCREALALARNLDVASLAARCQETLTGLLERERRQPDASPAMA